VRQNCEVISFGAGGIAGCEAERHPHPPPHGNRIQIHHRRIDPQGIRTQGCLAQSVFKVVVQKSITAQIRQLILYC